MDTEAHLDGVIDMISEERDLLQTQIATLTAENERLRDLLREVSTYFHGAIKHNILKVLQPKEGVK